MNERVKTVLPPYLALARLEKLVDLFSTRRFEQVSGKELRSYGFTGTDASVAMGTLRFLGLVDTQGGITEKARKFHLQGDSRKKELQGIIRDAFQELFKKVDEPYKLSRVELENEFLVVYDITPRIARTAVPAFLWLCGQAGLVEEGLVKVRDMGQKEKAGSPKERIRSSSSSVSKRERGEFASEYSFEHEGIRVFVPTTPGFTKAINRGKLMLIEEAI